MKIINIFSYRFTTILHGIWAIPVVGIIRIISPVLLIRLGTLRSDRIGHFVADAGQQFAISNNQKNRIIDLYWLDSKTCNKQWDKMVRRNFSVYSWVKYLDIWNNFISGGCLNNRPSSETGSRDIHGALCRSKVKMMEFLPHEEERSKSWMRSKGWSDGEPFVCLLVRDSAYLSCDDLHLGMYDYSYHDYRDSDINTYVEAIKWLESSGIWVFRMGKKMLNPVKIKSTKIIDYAFCSEKSDLLDIWLFANCSLCISTGSGPDMVSDVYRRPLLFLNFSPIMHFFSWSDALHVPKKLYWQKSGALLLCREYLEHGYFNDHQYKDVGINIVDLTSAEIKAAVKERWKKLEGVWVESNDEIEMKECFLKIASNNNDFMSYHGFIHSKSNIASTFLLSNPKWLGGPAYCKLKK